MRNDSSILGETEGFESVAIVGCPYCANYSIAYEMQDGKLLLKEKIDIQVPRVQPDDYEQFRSMMLQINQCEEQELLLLPETNAINGAADAQKGGPQ